MYRVVYVERKHFPDYSRQDIQKELTCIGFYGFMNLIYFKLNDTDVKSVREDLIINIEGVGK